MKFHESIKTTDSTGRPIGMTKRQVVLSLMRIAGHDNDRAKWMRLLVENPIGKEAADEAWRLGAAQRKESP